MLGPRPHHPPASLATARAVRAAAALCACLLVLVQAIPCLAQAGQSAQTGSHLVTVPLFNPPAKAQQQSTQGATQQGGAQMAQPDTQPGTQQRAPQAAGQAVPQAVTAPAQQPAPQTAASTAQAPAPKADPLAAHVLARLTYGPVPGDVERVQAQGVQAFIAAQLNPAAMPDPPELGARLNTLSTYAMDTVQLFRTYGPKGPGGPRPNPTLDEIKTAREKAAVIAREAAEARVWRALYSPRQLEELLVEFWYSHFNVSSDKGLAHLWVGSFEREAIRPYVLGRFEDMLQAVTRHPAMLIALENWQSSSPDSPMGQGQPRPLVELHARELLASHTVGPDGGFKPQDVTNLARILAGWSIGAPRTAQDRNGFLFDEKRHDSKDKPFMGAVIKGSGLAEGQEALRLLARHPATARFVCAKLARSFVMDEPSKDLLDRMAQSWQAGGGDLRAVMKTMLESPEFLDPRNFGVKIKPPLRYALSVVRAAGRPVAQVRPLVENLAWMGAALYEAPGPSGYKDAPGILLAPDILMARLEFAAMAGRGALACWVNACAPPTPLDAAALERAMGIAPGAATRRGMDAVAAELKAGVLLGSPEVQRY